MTEEQITTEIHRYISDNSYNYAVMINGDWGCGKTYFVKHDLSDAINEHEKHAVKPRRIIYVTLYGYKTILDIQDAIVAQLHIPAEKGKNSLWVRQRNNPKIDNSLQSALLLARFARNIFAPGASAFELEEIWRDLAAYIFIFDDVERCDCPLNEVFGFVNRLVEHRGVKVILVANEKEIKISEKNEHKELQYIVSADEKIIYPIPESIWRDKHDPVPLSPEELERRRKILFPTVTEDEEFKKIREKLIGVTLHFQPDVKEICRKIISNASLNQEVKDTLLGSIEYFYTKMQEAEHQNIRTFQFFISKLQKVIDSLTRLDIPLEYMEAVTDKVTSDCFSSAVDFKANLQPPEEEIARISFSIDREKRFQSIDHYIKTGELWIHLLREEIDRFIQENFISLIPSDDPYKQLQQEYYLHSQTWCEEKIKEILKKLEDDIYPSSIYGEIIQPLIILESMGFDKKNLDTAKRQMLANIAKMDHPQTPNNHFLLFEENQDRLLRAQQVLLEIENAVAERSNTVKKICIEEIVKQENWVEGMTSFAEQNHLENDSNRTVFSSVQFEIWVALLNKATPETISKLRFWFHRFYPTNIIWKNKPSDVDVLNKLAKEIKPDEVDDLILKNLFLRLKEDINRFCSLYKQDDID